MPFKSDQKFNRTMPGNLKPLEKLFSSIVYHWGAPMIIFETGGLMNPDKWEWLNNKLEQRNSLKS